MDGITLVKWALEVAKIPPERLVLVGQSLGTAVATAVAEHFVVESGIEFAGMVLVAAFSDLPTLVHTYSFGGIIPILAPLRPYPQLQKFFGRHIKDTWQTSTRLANMVRTSKVVNLVLIHAKNDFDIPWKHSDVLFHTTANATSDEGLSTQQIDGVKRHVELGTAGWRNSWMAGTKHGGVKRIRQEVLMHGGKSSEIIWGITDLA